MNKESIDWKKIYWLFVFMLLMLPLCNSFYVNTKLLIASYQTNMDRRKYLSSIIDQNKSISNRIRYSKTRKGQEALIKEKLNKVEKDELLIKFE